MLVFARAKKDVGGLEIAVNDARFVGLREAAADLHGDADRGVRRHALLARQKRREILPGQILHDEIEAEPVVGPDVEDLDDVVALDEARRAGLLPEAHGDVAQARQRRVNQLDGDALADLEVLRLAHDAHGAAADDASNAVLAGDRGADDVLLRDHRSSKYVKPSYRRHQVLLGGPGRALALGAREAQGNLAAEAIARDDGVDRHLGRELHEIDVRLVGVAE